MRNIFEVLNEKGICYAVNVALVEFASSGSGLCVRDYSVITLKSDLTKSQAQGYDFYESSENNYKIWERDLSEEDIRVFKDSQENFVKVLHNKEGRMYELKRDSFKEHYDKNNKA